MTDMTRRRAILLAAVGALALVPARTARAAGTVFAPVTGLRFEIYRDSKNNFRWKLKAANGRVVATSGEGYTSKAACRNGIDVVMQGAATATITDDTAS